jgi:ring-1,2-phenylacetyl-CoA epoxidase subunit PaaE
MSEFHALQIAAIERMTSQSVVLTITVPENVRPKYKFLPGQYVSLELTIEGTTVRRSYSICSAPHEGALQVGVKEVPKGVFSTYVNQKLKVGDPIQVGLPEGRFIFEAVQDQVPIMAVAAGSGITPIMSILKSVLHHSSSLPFTLVYGNKTPNQTLFYKELRALEKDYPEQLKVHWVFSQSNEEGAHFGRIDTALLNYALKQSTPTPERFYLCGPEAMIHFSEQHLMEKGIAKEHVLFELFTASSASAEITDTAEKGVLKITCDETTHTLDLIPGKTLLDIALQAKLDVPYSCQGGVCSSCIGKITEGMAQMQSNQILTDEEIEEGLVLTCQAIAQTEKVSVDYDDV